MKAGLVRGSVQRHTREGEFSIISQLLELLSHRKVKQLGVVLQNGAEVLSGSGPRVEWRVEAAELAVTRPGSDDDGQRPEPPGHRLEGGPGSKTGRYAGL